MRKKLLWSKTTNTAIKTVSEQYIPLPLALCDNTGVPLKGQKSYTTKALKAKYKSSTPSVFLNALPTGWVPECCIFEGMFMLNTAPLGDHKTFSDYGNFLIKRFLVPQWRQGAQQLHIIFDNPGRLKQTPKEFERNRRDNAATVLSGHLCDEVNTKTKIPSKWRENFINCRNCKRALVIFLTNHFLNNASKHMQSGHSVLVAGGFEGAIEDTAWIVDKDSKPQPDPRYLSNAEETDTRMWVNAERTSCTKILIMSPDTDCYHIGMTMQNNKDVIIQLNTYTYVHLKRSTLSSFISFYHRIEKRSSTIINSN